MIKRVAMVLMSVFLISVVLVGCGNDNANGNGNGGTTIAEPVTPVAPVEELSAVQQFLDEYGDEIRAEFGDIAELLGPGASIDVVAGNGEELIFVFTYGPDQETEGLGEILEILMPVLGDVFEEVAAELQVELGVDELTVTVEYRAYDGEVLASQSFVAS